MISSPAVTVPPCARRSAISASGMAWLPPTGIGQPTVCASVASISPAPAETSDGICEIVCAATPVNSARASAPDSARHAGVPCSSSRRATATAAIGSVGSERLSPSSSLSTASSRSTSGPSRRRHDSPSVKLGAGAVEVVIADRGGPARQRVGVGDLRHLQRHAAGRQIELGEERRRQRQRMHGRTDVVRHPGELRVGAGCARRRRGSAGPRTPAPKDRPWRR